MLKSAWYCLSFRVNDVFSKSPTGRTSSRGTHSKKQICNYIIAQKWLRINRKSLRSRVAYDKEIRKR
nr:MAG TPA: hypothetical protein [Caudoviricetes sp.]DAY77973.1 MAG TPA: hypothetical protein [Caudoviricetes sp.]